MPWVVGIGVWVWLAIVKIVWGFTAAALVGVSMLAVCLLALWEAGGKTNDER